MNGNKNVFLKGFTALCILGTLTACGNTKTEEVEKVKPQQVEEDASIKKEESGKEDKPADADTSKNESQETTENTLSITRPTDAPYVLVRKQEDTKVQEYFLSLSEEEYTKYASDATQQEFGPYREYAMQLFNKGEDAVSMDTNQNSISKELFERIQSLTDYSFSEPSEITSVTKAHLEVRYEYGSDGSYQKKESEITDPATLKELETIFHGATLTEMGEISFENVLTLTGTDGKEHLIYLPSIDYAGACKDFLYGSYGEFALEQEGIDRLCELFPDLKLEQEE